MAKCKKCGAELLEGALFCTECGEALTEPFKPEVQSVGNPFEELDHKVPTPQAASELIFDDPDWKKAQQKVEQEKAENWHGATGYGKPSWGAAAGQAQPEQSQSQFEQQASWGGESQTEQQAAWGAQPEQQAWSNADQAAQGSQYDQQASWGAQPDQQAWNNTPQNYNRDPYSGGIVENKGLAVLCYFSILLWAIAYILAAKKPKTEFLLQHLNQGIILNIVGVIAGAIQGSIGGVIGFIVFVLAIMGIINAIKGTSKPLPLVGQFRIFK